MTATLTDPATLVESWLDLDALVTGPAGPLFVGGRYAEYDITMTGGGGSGGAVQSNGVTGCQYCTGSRCDGGYIDCMPW